MKIFAVLALSVAGLMSPAAFAVTRSADIEASVGIEPLLTIFCTPIDFGVWNVVVGEMFSVDLDPNSVAPVLRPGSHATPSSSPNFGACTVTGSSEPDGTWINLRVSGGYPIVGDASVYPGMGAGQFPASVALSIGASSGVLSGGRVYMTIGGSADFGRITRQSMGAYKTSVPFTLTPY